MTEYTDRQTDTKMQRQGRQFYRKSKSEGALLSTDDTDSSESLTTSVLTIGDRVSFFSDSEDHNTEGFISTLGSVSDVWHFVHVYYIAKATAIPNCIK